VELCWLPSKKEPGPLGLYDLLKPHVAKVIVCNPRKNALLKDGNKNDRIDARKLAELLRFDNLKAVYHGETGVRMLRELARSYLTIVKDLTPADWPWKPASAATTATSKGNCSAPKSRSAFEV
jgi:Transposase